MSKIYDKKLRVMRKNQGSHQHSRSHSFSSNFIVWLLNSHLGWWSESIISGGEGFNGRIVVEVGSDG